MNLSIQKSVQKIIKRVETQGDRALAYYSLKYDKVSLFRSGIFPVPKANLLEAYKRISPSLREALLLAKKRIEIFHREELRHLNGSWSKTFDGIGVGQRRVALSKVGIYIPGGRTVYPSTVLMTLVPAIVAGVSDIIAVTPPNNLKDELLAAFYISEADAIYGIGGAWAIAALAYGTKTVQKVDKIFGPGNAYVCEAKRQLFGAVGIDSLAGPSEVVVWADECVSPKKIAINLLAQAEHDPNAKSYFFSCDRELTAQVKKEIPEKFLGQIKFIHENKIRSIILKINKIAPEHLWLAIKNARKVLPQIQNAGAVFLGPRTPVALGDYAAGPSHVLPTGSSARFSSGLSVKDFFKWSSVIETKNKNISKTLEAAKTIAQTEKLEYHCRSLEGV